MFQPLNRNNPLVSVIIPNKNRTDELYRAVNSVMSQTYKVFEVLIVDDSDIVLFNSIKNKYKPCKNIKIIRGDACGDGRARIKGLKSSVGKYIVFLDSDDELNKRKLETHLIRWRNNLNLGLTWDKTVEIGDHLNKSVIPTPKFIGRGGRIVKPKTAIALLSAGNFIHMSSGFTRRDYALKIINKNQFTGAFDYALWLHLAVNYDSYYVNKNLTIKHSEGFERLGRNKVGLFIEYLDYLKTVLIFFNQYNPKYKIGKTLLIRNLVVAFVISMHLSRLIPMKLRNSIRDDKKYYQNNL